MVARHCAAALILLLSLVATGLAVPQEVVLGPSDNVALDQPRVAIEVYEELGGGGTNSFGPEFSNTFLLDSGSTSIFAVNNAEEEMLEQGYQIVGTFQEQGLGGFITVNVSAPYQVDFAGTSGVRQTLSDVQIISHPTLSFGGFNGIVGMPAMVDRVTTISPNIWSGGIDFEEFDNLFIGVDFSDTLPASPGHRYSAATTLVSFPSSGSPAPTTGPLPFAAGSMRHGDSGPVESMFLLDTGAQVSMISSAIAFSLGLDTDNDGNFDNEALDFTTLTGADGNPVEVPIIYVERFALHTQQGVDLVWTDLEIVIHDIDPAIPALFGSDLITSGWIVPAFLPGEPDGYLQEIHFDFRDADSGQGVMYLDVTAALDNPVNAPLVPGDLDLNGMLTNTDIQAMLDALVDLEGYKTENGLTDADLVTLGDMDDSGEFTNTDIQAMLDTLTGQSGMSVQQIALAVFGDAHYLDGYARVVPEPASAAMLVMVSGALLLRGRSER